MKELTAFQRHATERAVRSRAKIEESKRKAERDVALAVKAGVSVRYLAKQMGVTRQRVYQMRDAGYPYLDV
jgi:transposase-like protein